MNEKQKVEVVSIRLVKEAPLYSAKEVHAVTDALEVIQKELATYDREIMGILALKTNGQVIHFYLASVGSLNAALIEPREIFKSAILANAASILAIHNHPSGTIHPSREDLVVTKRLFACGELLGIPLLDHVIVGGMTGHSYSFREHGLLDPHLLQTYAEQRVVEKKTRENKPTPRM